MYSRGIGSIEQDYAIPEKYDGTALLDLPQKKDDIACGTSPKFIDAQKKEVKFSPPENQLESAEMTDAESKKAEPVGIFSFAPMKWVKSILPDGLITNAKFPKIELEELIIIGLAVFLFFSKTGDKECALILLSLIFIR